MLGGFLAISINNDCVRNKNKYDESAITKNSSSHDLFMVGMCSEDKDKKIVFLKKSLKKNPQEPLALLALSDLYWDEMEIKEVFKLYEEYNFFDKNPEYIEYIKYFLAKNSPVYNEEKGLKLLNKVNTFSSCMILADYKDHQFIYTGILKREDNIMEELGRESSKYLKEVKRNINKDNFYLYEGCFRKYPKNQYKLFGLNYLNIKCNKFKKKLIKYHLLDEFWMGFAYYEGICTLKDYKKAYNYLARYIDRISKDIQDKQKEIISLKKSGEDTEDFESYLEVRFKNNHYQLHKGYTIMGDMYMNGLGVLKDKKKAVEYYKKASVKASKYTTTEDVLPALKKLAKLALENKSIDEAKIYLEKLAKYEDIESQLILGKMYLEKDNYSDAKHWLQKAYLNGSKEAKKIWEDNELSEK